MTSRPLFVTRLYEASLADAGLIAELEADSRAIADEDEAGRTWCEANAYGGYTSYASLTDLTRRATSFDLLRRKLDRHVAAFARELHFDPATKLRLESLWINILEPGAGHSGHIHPHSVVSGTIYLRTPKGSSALKLEDPRLAMMMAAPKRTEDAPEADRTFVYLTPQPGTVFLWESFLRHEVPANQARSERISLSFNYR